MYRTRCSKSLVADQQPAEELDQLIAENVHGDSRETVMKIRNVHERSMTGPATVVSDLLDGLAGPNDRLWPG